MLLIPYEISTQYEAVLKKGWFLFPAPLNRRKLDLRHDSNKLRIKSSAVKKLANSK